MIWGIVLVIVVLIPLIAVVSDSGIGHAIARRIEGGAPDSARLRALEEEVGQLSAEVRRIQEQSEFLTRLLEDRTRESGSRSLESGSRASVDPTGPEGGVGNG